MFNFHLKDKPPEKPKIIVWHRLNELPPDPLPDNWQQIQCEQVAFALWIDRYYVPDVDVTHRYIVETDTIEQGAA